MAEFLLLFRHGDILEAGLSPEQMQAQMQKWMEWMGELVKQGRVVNSQPLERTGKVVQGNNRVVTEGPYASGKEIIGGYLLCRADNIEAATEIAKGCPILNSEAGTVEVRPVGKM